MMRVETAIPMMLELAEQNALQGYEASGEDDYVTIEDQQEALEVVQNYIDTDYGLTMPQYTRDETCDALELIYELGQDNILDELLTDSDEVLEAQRAMQLEAAVVMHDHIVNHAVGLN